MMVKVAVDFDGTIVENRYPAIGPPMLFAFETLRAMQQRGMLLILWTLRQDRELDEAVEFCRQHGVEFYAVNRSYPEETPADGAPRKLMAEIFIDDRNLGGFPGWSAVWQTLFPEEVNVRREQRVVARYAKPPLWQRVLGLGRGR